jgi:hypothetical protein
VADDHDRLAFDAAEAADDGGVVREGAVAGQFMEFLECNRVADVADVDLERVAWDLAKSDASAPVARSFSNSRMFGFIAGFRTAER